MCVCVCGSDVHCLILPSLVGPPLVPVEPRWSQDQEALVKDQEVLANDHVLEVLAGGLVAPRGQEVDEGPIAPGLPTEGQGGHVVPEDLIGNHAHP